MTFESDWANKVAAVNRQFVDKAAAIAREIEVLLGREAMTYPRDPVRRAREALADRLPALLAAAREASTSYYNVDQLPVAILSDAFGDDWIDPAAEAVGTLAASVARAATLLTGAVGSSKDDLAKRWIEGLLEEVRQAAAEVIRRSAERTQP